MQNIGRISSNIIEDFTCLQLYTCYIQLEQFYKLPASTNDHTDGLVTVVRSGEHLNVGRLSR